MNNQASTTVNKFDDFNQPKIKLMTSRKFAPLFWTQFFAAFNDNFVKNTLVLLILTTVIEKQQEALTTLSIVIFMLPFLLLSATGGQLADRFDKAYLARLLKLAEIGLAVFAAIALFYSSILFLMIALFLFGVGSALFGPIKYAVLPEQIEQAALPTANAYIEAATFVAILGGTIGAAVVFSGLGSSWFASILIIIFAICAWFGSTLMPHYGSAQKDLVIDRNFMRATWTLLNEIVRERNLLIVALMVSWFWFLGAILLSVVPIITDVLGKYHASLAFFLTIFAVAVAIGSGIAAWLSAGRIVLLQSVIGTFIFGITALDFAWVIHSLPVLEHTVTTFAQFLVLDGIAHLSIDIAIMAMAGSFLVVPGFAALQAWAHPERRARVVAANNVLNAGAMVIGGAILALLQILGMPLYAVVLLLGISSIVAAFVMLRYLPTHPFRDFVSILFRACFRLEVKGFDNLSKAGKTPVLALNHVSFLDGLLAAALTENQIMNPPVFAINADIAQKWWIKPFLRYMNAYLLDPTKPMAVRGLISAVKNGAPLVIFPEGRITVTGSLMKVYDGAAMIADKTGCQIVPIKIDGLERTPFSRLNDIQIKKVLFPKVTVTITEPVSLDLDATLKSRVRRIQAGSELYNIMSDLMFKTSGKSEVIFAELIKAADLHGMRSVAIEDPIAGNLTYSKMLIAIRALAVKFAGQLQNQDNVGVLLPNSNAVALSFFALQSAGKIPAMLNFSAGFSALKSAINTAQLKSIITSRGFIKKAHLTETVKQLESELNIRLIYLEDTKENISFNDKLHAIYKRKQAVVNAINPHNPAVILFTSGSEGTPKGVVLTHANILANVNQAAARVDFNKADKVFNVLPVFHSFGLTAAMILPLVSGVPVYFYPSPLHYRIVPEAIYSSNSTIIFATDTFLSGYGRNAHPYDFRSIRYCFAGAEPVKNSTKNMMFEKFGVRILEGYGVTETSPILAINTPMYNKAGTVGKFLSSIEWQLDKVAGIETGGRLQVKGPNVMAGYLRAENPGVIEYLKDGWHDTGDIVDVDAEGFITIIGRVKRFAKIGGEMISLTAVENLASKCFANTLLAVVNIPDERKGEALILVSADKNVNRNSLLQFAREQGISELYVPSKIVYNTIPVLGTGKVNYPLLTEQVLQQLS